MKMFCGDNIIFSMETRAFAIESRVLLHQHAMEKHVFIYFFTLGVLFGGKRAASHLSVLLYFHEQEYIASRIVMCASVGILIVVALKVTNYLGGYIEL